MTSIALDAVLKGAALGAAEREYVTEVDRSLPSCTHRLRGATLGEVADLLAERPPAESYDEIVASVGPPAEVGEETLAAVRDSLPLGRLQRLRQRPLRDQLLVLGLILGIALGAGAVYRYFTVVPHIFNPCGGGQASEQIDLEAAGSRERVVTFRRDERVSAYLCPHSQDDGVEILDVRFPSDAGGMPLQPVGAETWTRTSTAIGRAGPIEPYLPTDDLSTQVTVWLEMDYCYEGDGRMGWHHIVVEYRYRWRTRTVDVPLHTVLSVTTGCDAASHPADIEDETRRWRDLVNERGAWNTLGPENHEPFHLTAEGISRDLCRYLRGVVPLDGFPQIEPLEDRAVFRLDDLRLAELLIDGAVLGICPEFAERRDELVALAADVAAKN